MNLTILANSSSIYRCSYAVWCQEGPRLWCSESLVQTSAHDLFLEGITGGARNLSNKTHFISTLKGHFDISLNPNLSQLQLLAVIELYVAYIIITVKNYSWGKLNIYFKSFLTLYMIQAHANLSYKSIARVDYEVLNGMFSTIFASGIVFSLNLSLYYLLFSSSFWSILMPFVYTINWARIWSIMWANVFLCLMLRYTLGAYIRLFYHRSKAG